MRAKKFEKHQAALGLHFGLDNYVTTNGTPKTTPAHAAGITDRKWSVAELIDRTNDYNPPPVQPDMFGWIPDSEE